MLNQGIGHLISTNESLKLIKDDLCISKQSVGQLKERMAQNTLRALELLAKKEQLNEIKRIINEEVISLRNSYNYVFRHIDEFDFVAAIKLCQLYAKNKHTSSDVQVTKMS